MNISKPRSEEMEFGWGKRFLGNSILNVQKHEDWKDRRKAFDPAFAKSFLQDLIPVFNNVSKSVLVDEMKHKANGHTAVNMKEVFAKVTLQIISQVAFSTDFTKDPFVLKLAGDKGLLHLVNNSFDGIGELFANPYAKYLFPWAGHKYIETDKQLRTIGRNCIQQRIRALENKEDVPQDILTRILGLLRANKKMDMEDMVDEFVTFYIAGQETTSNLLSFTLLLLLRHPFVLQRLVEEVDEVMGDKQTVDADDLENLIYMHQVLQESLRIYPPATLIAKESPPGFSLCGHPIPEKSFLTISIYSIHHSVEHFDDPEIFDPDRFGPGRKRPTPYVYLPFGIGHRICIGKVFAMMEAKVLLCHLLRSFKLSLPDDFKLKIKESITMSPADSLPCFCTLR